MATDHEPGYGALFYPLEESTVFDFFLTSDKTDPPSSPPSTASTGSTGSKRAWLWSDDEESSSDSEPDQKRVRRRSLSPIPDRFSTNGFGHHLRLPRIFDDFLDFCDRPRTAFVDKTQCLLHLPDRFRYLLLRPPKFGKTAFLSALSCFYDIHGAEQFMEYFGPLAVAKDASPDDPRHSQHLCLSLTLSDVRVHVELEELADRLTSTFALELKLFLVKYAAQLELSDPEDFLAEGVDDAFGKVFALVKARGHTLFVGIDAYDAPLRWASFNSLHNSAFQQNFASPSDIERLLDSCIWGPLLAGSDVIDKLFVTGTLSFQSPAFKSLGLSTPNLQLSCGFTEKEAVEFARSILDETAPDVAELRRVCGVYVFPSQGSGSDQDEPVLHPQRLFAHIAELCSPRSQEHDYSFQLLSDIFKLLPVESDVPGAVTINSLVELVASGAVEIDGELDSVRDVDGTSVFWSALYHAGALTCDQQSNSTLRVASGAVLSLIHSLIDKFVSERYDLQNTFLTTLYNYDMEGDPEPFLELMSDVLCDQTQCSFGRTHEPSLRGILELVIRNSLVSSFARPIDPIILLPVDVTCVPIVGYLPEHLHLWELKTLTLRGMWQATNLNDDKPTVEALEKLHNELMQDDEEQLLARPYRVWSPNLNAMETVLVGSFLDPEPEDPQFLAVGVINTKRSLHAPSFHTTLLPQTPETTQHVLTQGGYASTSQLPPRRSAKKDPFTQLLDETREIISSPDFACVFEACLDRATEVLLSSVENAVFASSTDSVPPGEEVRIRLAGLLPGLARWSHLAPNGLPNELVDNILDVRQVAALSAIVFGRFEERFQ
ncbi:Peroxin-3-domain-containing protein [Mycena galericulata]|nr:Peroxin-3-domain-containing protein [Mycena galericulata]